MTNEYGPSSLDGMSPEHVARLLAAAHPPLRLDTSIMHKPTITPATAGFGPGTAPTTQAFGTTLGLHYSRPTDLAYRIVKIPHNIVTPGNTAGIEPYVTFHVHWTKSEDIAQAGATVRWKMSYVVFDGETDDLCVEPTVVEWDAVYEDRGTTSHIVYRTGDIAAEGFLPGHYIGLQLEYVAEHTTLVDPVCLSADLLWRGWINTSDGETYDSI